MDEKTRIHTKREGCVNSMSNGNSTAYNRGGRNEDRGLRSACTQGIYFRTMRKICKTYPRKNERCREACGRTQQSNDNKEARATYMDTYCRTKTPSLCTEKERDDWPTSRRTLPLREESRACFGGSIRLSCLERESVAAADKPTTLAKTLVTRTVPLDSGGEGIPSARLPRSAWSWGVCPNASCSP